MYIKLQENNLGLAQVTDIQENVDNLIDNHLFIEVTGIEPYLGQFYVNGALVPEDQYDDIVEPLIRPLVPEPEIVEPIVIHAPVDEINEDEIPESSTLYDPNAPWEQLTEENLAKIDRDIEGLEHLIEHVQKPENHDRETKTLYLDFKMPDMVQLKVPRAVKYNEDTLEDYIQGVVDAVANMKRGRTKIEQGIWELKSSASKAEDTEPGEPLPIE